LDWKQIYNERLTTAAEAVKNIKSDSTIVLAHCVGEPPTIVRAIVENREQYRNLEIRHMVRLGGVDFTTPGYEKHFWVSPWFGSANSRAAIAENRADFTPCFFHEVPRVIREGRSKCDVTVCQVSPPDAHGFCSLGTSVDYTKQAVATAKLTIAQVNKNMPRTLGEGLLHVSEFDYIVEADDDLYEIQPPVIGDVEKAIGEYCASLIDDGSTLQLGIGAIPDAVMLFLKGKKDLGIHSEMISDGTLALYNEGIITGTKKSENPGKMTVTFLMGTRELYDFAHDNPVVEVKPVDYVNHPIVIARQYKMISVNSAIQADLQGQVNAEAMGLRQFSGVGGQVDFIRGVAMSQDGKAIIAMPSVTVKKDGTMISKIVPFLDQGAPVTTSRCDVDYIVTEYGIAELKAKSLRQRARNLIGIAHPDTRDALKEEFEKRFAEKY
jgi:4-hydroxybutyrate CoA-transferase